MILDLEKEKSLSTWISQPVSEIAHHGTFCCEKAKTWLIYSYASKTRKGAGSFWTESLLSLLDDYKWGPSPWPIFWCEVPGRENLDCGALASISRHILNFLEIEAYPTQLLHRKASESIAHGRQIWSDLKIPEIFAGKEFTYHELCMVQCKETQESRLFDTSYGFFLEEAVSEVYGGVAALRVQSPTPIKWAGLHLDGKNWVYVD